MPSTTTKASTFGRRLIAPALAALALAAFAGTPSAAATVKAAAVQPAPASLPAAKDLFERHIEAIGGREAVFAQKNRRITGWYEGAPFEHRAQIRVFWEADGRFHQTVAVPAGAKVQYFHNDGVTWAVQASADPEPITGMKRIELIDTADFYGEANYEKRYKTIETIGQGKAEEKPVYIVRATTHAGRPHTLYFDRESGLIVGSRVPVSTTGTGMRDMTLRIANYSDAGGVLYPTEIVQKLAGSSETNKFVYTKVVADADDEHDYSVPPPIKKLFDEAKAASEQNDGG